MLKNAFKKYPPQNRTNVQIKGGGGQRPFEQCSKKLHFFEMRASLTLICSCQSHTPSGRRTLCRRCSRPVVVEVIFSKEKVARRFFSRLLFWLLSWLTSFQPVPLCKDCRHAGGSSVHLPTNKRSNATKYENE